MTVKEFACFKELVYKIIMFNFIHYHHYYLWRKFICFLVHDNPLFCAFFYSFYLFFSSLLGRLQESTIMEKSAEEKNFVTFLNYIDHVKLLLSSDRSNMSVCNLHD